MSGHIRYIYNLHKKYTQCRVYKLRCAGLRQQHSNIHQNTPLKSNSISETEVAQTKQTLSVLTTSRNKSITQQLSHNS